MINKEIEKQIEHENYNLYLNIQEVCKQIESNKVRHFIELGQRNRSQTTKRETKKRNRLITNEIFIAAERMLWAKFERQRLSIKIEQLISKNGKEKNGLD